MFVRGAYVALARARREGGFMAILKEKSPSCASSEIYNGEFSGTLVPGKRCYYGIAGKKTALRCFRKNR